MGSKKKGAAAFTLVLDKDAVRVRKAIAPAVRVHADKDRKKPRNRPDLLADMDEERPA